MSIVRKISIGLDYKTSMHYIVGQEVLGGSYTIHQIIFDEDSQSHLIYIEKDQEIVLWKEFNKNVPVAKEYNINF